jgi:hypothetical protein
MSSGRSLEANPPLILAFPLAPPPLSFLPRQTGPSRTLHPGLPAGSSK